MNADIYKKAIQQKTQNYKLKTELPLHFSTKSQVSGIA